MFILLELSLTGIAQSMCQEEGDGVSCALVLRAAAQK